MAQQAAPAARRPAPAPAAAPQAAPKPAPKSSFGSGGAAIVAAALAQLGVSQDCVSLATNSLARAGYPGLTTYTIGSGYGPMVGYTVYNPQPGDIVYYTDSRHVAIYIGNGQAVHGGYRTKWGGKTTKIDSVGVTPGGVIYRRVW